MNRLLLLILAVSFLVSCGGSGSSDSGDAALRVTFNPNPVSQASDNKWWFRVTVTETRGIGVTITSWNSSLYTSDGKLIYQHPKTDQQFSDQFNDCGGSGAYIPGGLTRCGNYLQILKGGRTSGYKIYVFVGMDDMGNEVSGSGRLDLQP